MNTLQFQSRDEWLAARRRFIGSSDVPAILGIGYASQSAYSVYADKVSPADKKPIDKATALRFQRGLIAERFVIELAKIEIGLDATHHAEPVLYLHPSIDYWAASCDSHVIEEDETRPVEAKLVGPHNWHDWDGDKPPLRHAVQVQHQLACTGATIGYLVGWCGEEIKFFEIRRDDRYLAAAGVKLAEFWEQFVLAKRPPTIDWSSATAAALRQMYPVDTGEVVELPESAVAWYEARQQAKEEIKSLQRAVDEADSRFKAALKTAAYGLLPDGRAVSWKSHERAAYTVEAQTVRPLKFLNKLPRDVAKHGDFINVSSDTPAIEAIAGSAAESSAQSD